MEELINIIPDMKSNTAPYGVAKASSKLGTNTNEPYQAFNRNNSIHTNSWASSNMKYGWLSYEFPFSRVVRGYTVVARERFDGESPRAWTFEGRSGSGDWSVLHRVINEVNWKPFEERSFFFSNEANFDEYRMNISDNNGYNYLAILQVKMYEKNPSGSYLVKKDGVLGTYKNDFVEVDDISEYSFKNYGFNNLSSLVNSNEIISKKMELSGDTLKVNVSLDSLIYNEIKKIAFPTSLGPGPKTLIAGNKDAGFYGEVTSSKLWNGNELSNLLSFNGGDIQFSNTNWLKFSYQGSVLFRPMKAIRYKTSMTQLINANLVDGNRIITHSDGNRYKVRLMNGAHTDTVTSQDFKYRTHQSEWNKLMVPIHIESTTKNWTKPESAEVEIESWGVNYTDVDLQVNNYRNGSGVWCRNKFSDLSNSYLDRGRYGITEADRWSVGTNGSGRGWAPVLELIKEIKNRDLPYLELDGGYFIAYNKGDSRFEITTDLSKFSFRPSEHIEMNQNQFLLKDLDNGDIVQINSSLKNYISSNYGNNLGIRLRLENQDSLEENSTEVEIEVNKDFLNKDLLLSEEVEILTLSDYKNKKLSISINKEPNQLIVSKKIDGGGALSQFQLYGDSRVIIKINEIYYSLDSSLNLIEVEIDESIVYEESVEGEDYYIIKPRNKLYLEELFNLGFQLNQVHSNQEVKELLKTSNDFEIIYILDESSYLNKLEVSKNSEVKSSPTSREYEVKYNIIKEV